MRRRRGRGRPDRDRRGTPVWTALIPAAAGTALEIAGVHPAFAIGALATAMWLIAWMIAIFLNIAAEP